MERFSLGDSLNFGRWRCTRRRSIVYSECYEVVWGMFSCAAGTDRSNLWLLGYIGVFAMTLHDEAIISEGFPDE